MSSIYCHSKFKVIKPRIYTYIYPARSPYIDTYFFRYFWSRSWNQTPDLVHSTHLTVHECGSQIWYKYYEYVFNFIDILTIKRLNPSYNIWFNRLFFYFFFIYYFIFVLPWSPCIDPYGCIPLAILIPAVNVILIIQPL